MVVLLVWHESAISPEILQVTPGTDVHLFAKMKQLHAFRVKKGWLRWYNGRFRLVYVHNFVALIVE